MQEKPIRFGTGGWRAVIGSDFIESNIRRTAEGICALMCEEGRTDSRSSSATTTASCPKRRRAGLPRFWRHTECRSCSCAVPRRLR